eukprot:s21_g17.t1
MVLMRPKLLCPPRHAQSQRPVGACSTVCLQPFLTGSICETSGAKPEDSLFSRAVSGADPVWDCAGRNRNGGVLGSVAANAPPHRQNKEGFLGQRPGASKNWLANSNMVPFPAAISLM